MRIKVGSKYYKLRKEAELDWMFALAALSALAFFPTVRLLCVITVNIARMLGM